ncbi:MAG: hypothetical protein ACLR5Q_07175 [Coprococcus sp.]
MNQFTPVSELHQIIGLNHTISASDYDALVDYAGDIGVSGLSRKEKLPKVSFRHLCEGV